MLKFEELTVAPLPGMPKAQLTVHRARVPGGWLVVLWTSGSELGYCFVTDPQHEWDGSSLPEQSPKG